MSVPGSSARRQIRIDYSGGSRVYGSPAVPAPPPATPSQQAPPAAQPTPAAAAAAAPPPAKSVAPTSPAAAPAAASPVSCVITPPTGCNGHGTVSGCDCVCATGYSNDFTNLVSPTWCGLTANATSISSGGRDINLTAVGVIVYSPGSSDAPPTSVIGGTISFLKTPGGIATIVAVALLFSLCCCWKCWKKLYRSCRKPKEGARPHQQSAEKCAHSHSSGADSEERFNRDMDRKRETSKQRDRAQQGSLSSSESRGDFRLHSKGHDSNLEHSRGSRGTSSPTTYNNSVYDDSLDGQWRPQGSREQYGRWSPGSVGRDPSPQSRFHPPSGQFSNVLVVEGPAPYHHQEMYSNPFGSMTANARPMSYRQEMQPAQHENFASNDGYRRAMYEDMAAHARPMSWPGVGLSGIPQGSLPRQPQISLPGPAPALVALSVRDSYRPRVTSDD